MKDKLVEYFGEEWYEQLKDMLHSDYFNRIGLFLQEERKNNIVYPLDDKSIFTAFKTTPFNKVKGVVLGQD